MEVSIYRGACKRKEVLRHWGIINSLKKERGLSPMSRAGEAERMELVMLSPYR